MRAKHHLFQVQGIAPKSSAKVCAQWRMSFSLPVACYRPFYGGDFGVILTSRLMIIGVDALCSILYSVINYLYTPRQKLSIF